MTAKEYYNKHKGKTVKLGFYNNYGVICGYDEDEIDADNYRFCLIAAVIKGEEGWDYYSADFNEKILTHKNHSHGYDYCRPIDCQNVVINITINV